MKSKLQMDKEWKELAREFHWTIKKLLRIKRDIKRVAAQLDAYDKRQKTRKL